MAQREQNGGTQCLNRMQISDFLLYMRARTVFRFAIARAVSRTNVGKQHSHLSSVEQTLVLMWEISFQGSLSQTVARDVLAIVKSCLGRNVSDQTSIEESSGSLECRSFIK